MLECISGNLLYKLMGIWLLLSGIAALFVMGSDKDRALYHEWRISEKTLFLIALVGGSFRMVLGSKIFHHKTSKVGFFLVLYAIVGVWLFVLQRIGFLGCLVATIPY